MHPMCLKRPNGDAGVVVYPRIEEFALYQSSDVVLYTDLDIADDMATVGANGISNHDMQDIAVADLFSVSLAKLRRALNYPVGPTHLPHNNEHQPTPTQQSILPQHAHDNVQLTILPHALGRSAEDNA